MKHHVNFGLFLSQLYITKTDNDNNMLSWDTEVSNLTNNATVMLEYNNNLEGKEVALIHETHDNNGITGYELIEANYNDQTGVISFETNGFSSYAIVYKTDNNTTDPNDPNDPGNSDVVQVTFVTDCDIEIGPISVNKNDPVERPNDPEKHGFRFLGWFTEDNQEYTFTDPVGDSDLTLYAHWEEIDESTLETYDVPDSLGNIISFNGDPANAANPIVAKFVAPDRSIFSICDTTSLISPVAGST